MRIILTGASGLIGSRFEELLFENHEIIPLASSTGVDITDKNSITQFLDNKSADTMIHLAAKTDVDGCELDKDSDLKLLNIEDGEVEKLNVQHVDPTLWIESKSAFAVNCIGTRNLQEVASEKNIKFVYVSTDFIFSGDEAFYTEESTPKPINWYGMTKYLGEKSIDLSNNIIARIAFPYGYLSPVKKDFVWKLTDLIRERDEISLLSDQIITPTFVDDVILGLLFLIEKQVTGVWHLTGSQSLTPKEIGEKIKETYGYTATINQTTRDILYAGKASRPFQSVMKNDKLTSLGFRPKTFDEGLDLLKNT